MGKKQPKQSLARRDGDGTNGVGRAGGQDIAKGDSDRTNATAQPAEATAAAIAIPATSGRLVEGTAAVKPKRYSPPACKMCAAIRPAGTSYTEVYSVRREYGYNVRYCRCRFCGDTFKDAVKE